MSHFEYPNLSQQDFITESFPPQNRDISNLIAKSDFLKETIDELIANGPSLEIEEYLQMCLDKLQTKDYAKTFEGRCSKKFKFDSQPQYQKVKKETHFGGIKRIFDELLGQKLNCSMSKQVFKKDKALNNLRNIQKTHLVQLNNNRLV